MYPCASRNLGLSETSEKIEHDSSEETAGTCMFASWYTGASVINQYSTLYNYTPSNRWYKPPVCKEKHWTPYYYIKLLW